MSDSRAALQMAMADKPTLPLPIRRWLTTQEACAYLGVSPPTLKSLGVKPSRNLGPQALRYDRIKLDEAMEVQDGIPNH